MKQKESRMLVLVRKMTDDHVLRVRNLVAECRRQDGRDTDIFIEPVSENSGNRGKQFLFYAGNELIGVSCLSGGDEVEMQLLVHPDHRRRGVGRILLQAVRDQCRLRGSDTLLLVCDQASVSGNAFAQSIGAEPAFSEFLLQYDPSVGGGKTSESPETIQLRAVGAEARDTILSLNAASHDEPREMMSQQIDQWLSETNQQFYIGRRLNGEDVGLLRAASFEDEVYICTFSVLPGYRGRGYGRQMLAQIVTVLSDENKTIRLEVESENQNALSLYRSAGFREVTAYRYYRLQV